MITKVNQLTCDTCGHSELLDDSDTVVSRIKAQGRGWKFMTYQNLQVEGDRRPRARQWDACADCSLPLPGEVASSLIVKK